MLGLVRRIWSRLSRASAKDADADAGTAGCDASLEHNTHVEESLEMAAELS